MGCADPVDVKTWALGISLFILTVLTYVPQYIKFYQTKTHRGVSLANFSCASLVNFCSFLAHIAADYSTSIACCNGEYDAGQCIGKNFGTAQLMAIWVCSSLIVALFFWYFEMPPADAQPLLAVEGSVSHLPALDKLPCAPYLQNEYCNTKIQITLLCLCTLGFAVTLAVLSVLNSIESSQVKVYATGLQYFASVVIALHWLPQIWVTYSLGSLGSLSYLMLLVQSFGSLLTAYNVCGGFECSWQTWLPYIVASLMLSALVVLATFQWVHRKRLQRNRVQSSRTTAKSSVVSTGAGSESLRDVDLNSDDEVEEDSRESGALESPVVSRH